MKTIINLVSGVTLLGLISCAPGQQGLGSTVQGTGSVEDLERQSPVTDAPDVREGEMARAAAAYSGDRLSGYGNGYGRGFYNDRHNTYNRW